MKVTKTHFVIDLCIAIVIIAGVMINLGVWFGFDSLWRTLSLLSNLILVIILFGLVKLSIKLIDYIHNRMLTQKGKGFIEIKETNNENHN